MSAHHKLAFKTLHHKNFAWKWVRHVAHSKFPSFFFPAENNGPVDPGPEKETWNCWNRSMSDNRQAPTTLMRRWKRDFLPLEVMITGIYTVDGSGKKNVSLSPSRKLCGPQLAIVRSLIRRHQLNLWQLVNGRTIKWFQKSQVYFALLCEHVQTNVTQVSAFYRGVRELNEAFMNLAY